MSQENVEVVRRACEAWGTGELDAWLETLHPHIVWDSTRFGGLEEGTLYRGRDEVRSFLVDEWRASWESFEAGVEEVADVGDGVLVLWWQRLVGAKGDVPITVRSAQICSVRDGKVIRIDNYIDRAEALEAVGLED
jgi:ketosteroid isomerase-like protein